jgi:hypothetical protein
MRPFGYLRPKFAAASIQSRVLPVDARCSVLQGVRSEWIARKTADYARHVPRRLSAADARGAATDRAASTSTWPLHIPKPPLLIAATVPP